MIFSRISPSLHLLIFPFSHFHISLLLFDLRVIVPLQRWRIRCIAIEVLGEKGGERKTSFVKGNRDRKTKINAGDAMGDGFGPVMCDMQAER